MRLLDVLEDGQANDPDVFGSYEIDCAEAARATEEDDVGGTLLLVTEFRDGDAPGLARLVSGHRRGGRPFVRDGGTFIGPGDIPDVAFRRFANQLAE